MKSKEYSILFVSSGNSANDISPIVKNQGASLIKKGIYLDYFTINGNGLMGYATNVARLRNLLKEKKYDLIHAHYGLSGLVAFFAKRKEKLLVSFMGEDLLGNASRNGKKNIKATVLVALNKMTARKFYDYVIVKSEVMAKALGTVQSLEILPNGVDFDLFYPIDKVQARKALNINLKTKLILFAADPARQEKNFALVEKTLERIYDPDIELRTIYDRPQKELNLYYNAADVLVLSSFFEGSPNVIKEAMACNCPIVTTDVGDVGTTIGKTPGCYISGSSPKEFEANIRSALRFNQRTNGRDNIVFLDSGKTAKRLIEIYKNMLIN